MPTHPLTAAALPRGVRLNNPGNIRRSKDPWQGLAAEQRDRDFFTFEGPEWGIRAMARILIKYQDDYGLDTVRKIIGRWAPPSENNVDAYVSSVAQRVGVRPDQRIDVQSYGFLAPLVVAMIRHECANYTYPQAVIDKGLALAGVVPDDHTVVIKKPQPPASRDTGVLAATAGAISAPIVAAKAIADSASGLNDSLGPLLGGYAPAVCVVVLLAAIAVLCWRVYSRRRAEAA